VGSRGRCSVEEESAPTDFWEGAGEFVEEFETCVNLKRPFNFWPNWEADVERDRVPLTWKVGLLEREVEVVIIVVRALAQHSLGAKEGTVVVIARERARRCRGAKNFLRVRVCVKEGRVRGEAFRVGARITRRVKEPEHRAGTRTVSMAELDHGKKRRSERWW
jgi:hypothetical protein